LGSRTLQQLVFVTFISEKKNAHNFAFYECGVLDFQADSFVDFLGLRKKVASSTRTTTPATGRLVERFSS